MHEDGFSIVEALTAMAILAVALVSLYEVGADALNAGAHVARTDRAVLFAETKLEELALVSTPLPKLDEGTSEGFEWNVVARELPGRQIATERRVLQDVTLVVRWRDGLNMQSISIGTRHLGMRN